MGGELEAFDEFLRQEIELLKSKSAIFLIIHDNIAVVVHVGVSFFFGIVKPEAEGIADGIEEECYVLFHTVRAPWGR